MFLESCTFASRRCSGVSSGSCTHNYFWRCSAVHMGRHGWNLGQPLARQTPSPLGSLSGPVYLIFGCICLNNPSLAPSVCFCLRTVLGSASVQSHVLQPCEPSSWLSAAPFRCFICMVDNLLFLNNEVRLSEMPILTCWWEGVPAAQWETGNE